jgi:hypothetical protein
MQHASYRERKARRYPRGDGSIKGDKVPFHELFAAVSKERTLQTFLPQGASLEVENELRALVNMPPPQARRRRGESGPIKLNKSSVSVQKTEIAAGSHRLWFVIVC